MVFLVHTNLNAQTNVSGGIYSSTSWTVSGSPYIVTGNVTVFPGVTLTIQPGVIVKFNNTMNLAVRGILYAIGTVSDSITFTSSNTNPTQGDWDMISIETWNGGSAYFKFCKIQYAFHGIDIGSYWGGSGPVILSRTRFYNNMVCNYGYEAFTWNIDTCSFINNYYGVQSSTSVVRGSTFLDNTSIGIEECSGVYYSNFCGNDIAIGGISGKIRHCLINNNNTGIQYPNSGSSIDSNIIVENNIGIDLANTNVGINNIICNNTLYNVRYNNTINQYATNNCWCSTDSIYIASTIYDGYDNASYGLLYFSPYLICDQSAIPTITNCSITTGLYDENTAQSMENDVISIFPNPFDVATRVEFHCDMTGIFTLNVFNIFGQNVIKIDNIQSNYVILKRERLSNGLYLIQLLKDNKQVGMGKVIIE